MLQTTFSKPCWWAIRASVLPSTSTTRPCFRMAVLARSMRYSVRLLSNSAVAGVLRYLGPWSRPVAWLAATAAQDAAREAGGAAVVVADGEHDAARKRS